jgi:DNA-directed RNA polymerase specialized sigma subunit
MNNFGLLYKLHKHQIDSISHKFTLGTRYSLDDMKQVLTIEFWFKLEKFDSEKWDNIEGFMQYALSQKAIRELNRQKWYLETKDSTYLEDINQSNGEEDAATFEIADTFNLEETVTDSLVKRQLIEKLVENKKDPLTTAIVREYLSPEQPSPTAIGLKLGVHHEIVKRRIKSLSKFFDEKQFGSLDSYLAV